MWRWIRRGASVELVEVVEVGCGVGEVGVEGELWMRLEVEVGEVLG